jgi:hypothetical protein
MKLSEQVKPISYLKAHALLQILALGAQYVAEGRVRPVDEAMAGIRARLTV